MHKQSFSDKMRIFLAKYSEISERLNSSTIDEQLKKTRSRYTCFGFSIASSEGLAFIQNVVCLTGMEFDSKW